MPVRTTVYLDDQLAARIKRLVPHRSMTRLVNESLADKVASIERAQLEAQLRAGYIAAAQEDAALAEDWEQVSTSDWPE